MLAVLTHTQTQLGGWMNEPSVDGGDARPPRQGGNRISRVCVCVRGYLHIDKSQFNIELFQQPDGFNLPVNVCVSTYLWGRGDTGKGSTFV